MKKVLIIVAALLVTVFLCTFMTRNQVGKLPTELNQEISQYLVYVKGIAHSGSGVVVKSDEKGSLILTNKHVCGPHKLTDDVKQYFGNIPSYIMLLTYNKTTAIAQPMKVAINSDLCLLHTIQTNLEVAPIAKYPVKTGESLFTCGNPLGLKGLCYDGYAADFKYIFFMLYRGTTVPARPGQSGSGIFNVHGELVGLVSLGLPGGAYSAMVPLSHIKLFLAGIEL